MLDHLTNYLLEYKTVTVPNVGTLHLVQESPRLNIAEKRIDPPFYTVEIKEEEAPSDHQLNYLRSFAVNDALATKLELFGNSLQQKIKDGGFDWKGLGLIKSDTQRLSLDVAALQPIVAEKVIRQDARHTVLVGDREVVSANLSEHNADAFVSKKKRDVSVTVGWILLLLSVLAIALVLYLGKLAANASGSKLPPTGFVRSNQKLLKL